MGQRRLPAPGDPGRRPGVPDGVDISHERPRPGQLPHEHRIPHARIPVPGGLGLVRPRHSERQPADVHRPAGPEGPALQRQGGFLRWIPADGPSGDDHQRRRARADLRPLPAVVSRVDLRRSRARGVASTGRDEPPPCRTERGRLAARNADRILRAGRANATRAPRGARPGGRVGRHAPALRPRRAGDRGLRPALPARPAAPGTGRPLRSGLERRGARRTIGTTTPTSRRNFPPSPGPSTARPPACCKI